MIRPSLRILFIIALGSGAGYAYLTRAVAPVEEPPAVFATHWKHRTEQESIVSDVVGAIVTMTHYARTREAAGPDALAITVSTEATNEAPRFRLVVPGATSPLRLQARDSIWSPGLYAPVVRDLLGDATLTPAAESAGSTTLKALLRPRADVFVRENRVVSDHLARSMTDAGAHEDAALILAGFALKEWSGRFHDTRHTLSRLAAHLAMSQALRNGSPPSPSGRLAEATLEALSWRQREAMQILDALDAASDTPPAVRAWTRTLRLRVTGDWRLLPAPERASLLEQREYFLWANVNQSCDRAMAFLDRIDDSGLSDWASIAFTTRVNVGNGQRFMAVGQAGLLEELASTGVVSAHDPKSFVDALNERPSVGPVLQKNGRATVDVIDTGTWAAFAQRHLLHHAQESVQFYRNMLGLKDEASQYQASLVTAYGGLRLFPLAARHMAYDRATYATAMSGAQALLANEPESVPGFQWKLLSTPPEFAADSFPVPEMEAWLQPLHPAGTYFEWEPRFRRPDGQVRLHLRGAGLARMRAAMPYNSEIAIAETQDRLGIHVNGADLRRESAAWVDFELEFARWVADMSKDDPAEFTRRYQRIGEIDPEALETLAWELAERRDDRAAEETFERYLATSTDPVSACNTVGWLVHHYFKTGRSARALEVARDAADTYCGAGLKTLALLYEDMGRPDEAQAWFERNLERYDDEAAMVAFLVRRQRKGDDRKPEQRLALLKKFSPTGFGPVGELGTVAYGRLDAQRWELRLAASDTQERRHPGRLGRGAHPELRAVPCRPAAESGARDADRRLEMGFLRPHLGQRCGPIARLAREVSSGARSENRSVHLTGRPSAWSYNPHSNGRPPRCPSSPSTP